jgi:hypothetical protein
MSLALRPFYYLRSDIFIIYEVLPDCNRRY